MARLIENLQLFSRIFFLLSPFPASMGFENRRESRFEWKQIAENITLHFMTADTSIHLGNKAQQFIEISDVEKFSDGSGYTSWLTVSSDPFFCSEHRFDFNNLDEFAAGVANAYERLGGKVRLAHIYENDFVEIEVLQNGHVKTSGLIVKYEPDHQELRFAFRCDQTFLPDFEVLEASAQGG